MLRRICWLKHVVLSGIVIHHEKTRVSFSIGIGPGVLHLAESRSLVSSPPRCSMREPRKAFTDKSPAEPGPDALAAANTVPEIFECHAPSFYFRRRNNKPRSRQDSGANPLSLRSKRTNISPTGVPVHFPLRCLLDAPITGIVGEL